MRKDCNYRFCDKTRFVQHTARHERLDTLCGSEFEGFRGVPCGRQNCELNSIHQRCKFFFYILQFSVVQILREINFGESRNSKTAFFAILEALNSCTFGKFQQSKSPKIHKNQNSGPLNWLKWHILNF